MSEEYMRRAIELAKEAAAAGEVPVGAVVVRKKDGLIVGEGRNRREERRCPTAHAELEAIEQVSWRLAALRLRAVCYAGALPHVRRGHHKFTDRQSDIRSI